MQGLLFRLVQTKVALAFEETGTTRRDLAVFGAFQGFSLFLWIHWLFLAGLHRLLPLFVAV